MRKLIPFCLAFLLITSCCLTGCAEADTVQESDLADKTYTYEKDGFGGDFTITLMEDGSFTYYEGMLSSYIGSGSWTLEGDVLHLAEKRGSYDFAVDGSDLVFLAESSAGFTYVEVADGARFVNG